MEQPARPTAQQQQQPLTQIVLTNKKILNYFKENKTVDPEKMFLFFIEFLDKLGLDITERMQATISTQILGKLSDILLTQERIYHSQDKLKQGQDSLKDQVNTQNQALATKLQQIKQEYLDELRNIYTTELMTASFDKSNHEHLEKVSCLIEKTNATLTERVLDKTNLMLNELLPRNNTVLASHIEESIRSFQLAMNSKMDTETNLKEYIFNLEKNFNVMMNNLQVPLQNNVALAQQQIVGQEKMQIEIAEFLNKYRNSSFKGQMGENYLFHLLNQLYPSAEIVKTGGQRASGDMVIRREGKPAIMIENKDYSANVSNDEIHKFIRDIDELKMHGIFLSQRSGIISKNNFQIDIHKGCILVYIHNAEYSQEKIQIAINMIDTLHTRLDETHTSATSSENIIPVEVLNEIYKEYQEFIAQRDTLISTIKESNKKILSSVEGFKFNALNKFLSSKYAIHNTTTLKNSFPCETCGNFIGTTKSSLAAHKRGCKGKLN